MEHSQRGICMEPIGSRRPAWTQEVFNTNTDGPHRWQAIPETEEPLSDRIGGIGRKWPIAD